MSKRFQIERIELARANDAIAAWHRHHRPVVAHVFSMGCYYRASPLHLRLVGAAIVGRPVSRHLDDGLTLEVSRSVAAPFDEARHACSALLAAAAREAWRSGILRMVTYTLTTESGASLRAAGWRRDRHRLDSWLEWDASAQLLRRKLVDQPFPARSWDMPGRRRQSAHAPAERWRWQTFAPVLRNGRGWMDPEGWTPAERMGIAAHDAGARFDSNPFEPLDGRSWEEWRVGYAEAQAEANPY